MKDVIIASRYSAEFEPVMDKVYTRDLYFQRLAYVAVKVTSKQQMEEKQWFRL